MSTLTIKKRPSRMLRGIKFMAYDPADVVVSFKWTDPRTGNVYDVKIDPGTFASGAHVSVDYSDEE